MWKIRKNEKQRTDYVMAEYRKKAADGRVLMERMSSMKMTRDILAFFPAFFLYIINDASSFYTYPNVFLLLFSIFHAHKKEGSLKNL